MWKCAHFSNAKTALAARCKFQLAYLLHSRFQDCLSFSKTPSWCSAFSSVRTSCAFSLCSLLSTRASKLCVVYLLHRKLWVREDSNFWYLFLWQGCWVYLVESCTLLIICSVSNDCFVYLRDMFSSACFILSCFKAWYLVSQGAFLHLEGRD